MSLIRVTDLTFSYDTSFDNIFENVSFEIDTDWKLGFTGRNGRGKTTFLNLLQGKYEYQGSITHSVTFDYFPFEVAEPDQMVSDLAQEMIPDLELWQLNKEFSYLDLPEDIQYRIFSTLSNGEQTKVLLALLFLQSNHFLLIDEPTNHLDIKARDTVRKYLSSKKGFILVSHDRTFLDSCIDHILSINKTKIEIQKGNFSTWQENKNRQDNYELAENEKLKKQIKDLTASARRTAGWSDQLESSKFGGGPCNRGYIGAKSAKMMKRAKSIENRRNKAVEEKSSLLKDIETMDTLEIRPLQYLKDTLVTVQDLCIYYNGKSINQPVSFSIKQGERLSLNGRNGAGKSSLLKLLQNYDISYTGEISIGSNLTISYVNQDTSYLTGSLSEYIYENGLNDSLFKTMLKKLDFSRIQFEKDMSEYSGGQKKKVLLAKSLCENAHLYIWDEPLNFIDIFSRMQIEQLILEYQPTLIFVEHDATFTKNIATKIVEVNPSKE
jgi:lincosamide and streptogramin A transport system ATP-binding/permease protein